MFRMLSVQMIRNRKTGQGLIFLFFLSVVVVLRLSSFSRLVIDWDESIYLLMARELLNGHAPYISIWDHKPPGIYVLFALAQIVFGASVVSIRISACIAVSISSFLLYRFGRRVFENSKVGLFAALLYMAFSLKNDGLGSNTEIFFTPFVILSFYLVCTRIAFTDRLSRANILMFVMTGLLLGFSLQINYITSLYLGAILLLVTAKIYKQRKENFLAYVFICNSLVLLGAFFLFVLVFLYFGIAGHFSDYYHANFTANLMHSRTTLFSLSRFIMVMALQVKHHLVLWFSVLLAPFFLAVFRKSHPRCIGDIGILATWLAFAMLAVGLLKNFYQHHFLQLLPPLCLITSYIVVNGLRWGRVFKRLRLKYVLVLVIIVVLMGSFFCNPYNILKSRFTSLWNDKHSEVLRLVSSHMDGTIDENSYIYVVDYEPMLYYLLEAKHPTRYVFPPFIIDEHFSRVAGVNPINELDSIMTLRPQYVIMVKRRRTSPFYARLAMYLRRNYVEEACVHGISIYRISTVDE